MKAKINKEKMIFFSDTSINWQEFMIVDNKRIFTYFFIFWF